LSRELGLEEDLEALGEPGLEEELEAYERFLFKDILELFWGNCPITRTFSLEEVILDELDERCGDMGENWDPDNYCW
jgi:hypothetical protein